MHTAKLGSLCLRSPSSTSFSRMPVREGLVESLRKLGVKNPGKSWDYYVCKHQENGISAKVGTQIHLLHSFVAECQSSDSRTVWFFIQVLIECLRTYHLQNQAQQASFFFWPLQFIITGSCLIWILQFLGALTIQAGPYLWSPKVLGKQDLANTTPWLTSTLCEYPSKSQKLPTSSTQIALLAGLWW